MKRSLSALGLVCALVASACGGSDGAPTLPPAPSTTTSTTTTTLAPTTTTTTVAPTTTTTTEVPVVAPPDWAPAVSDEDFTSYLAVLDDYFRSNGIAYSIDVEMGVIGTGEEFALGLTEVTQKVFTSDDQTEWPGVIAQHFDALFATISANPGVPATWEDGEPVIRLRLYDQELIDEVQSVGSSDVLATEIVRGIYATVVLDLPSAVRPLRDDDVAPWNVADGDIFDAALQATLDDPDLVIEPFELNSGVEYLSLYNSFFSSTAVLGLDSVLDEPVGQDGALVIMPVRDVLIFHNITDATSQETVEELALVADPWFRDGPSSLSPFVYWLRNGELLEVAFVIPDVGVGFSSGAGQSLLDLVSQ